MKLFLHFDHADSFPIPLLPKFIRLAFQFAATFMILIPVISNTGDGSNNLKICEKDWNDKDLNCDVIIADDGYIERYTPKSK